MAGGRPLKFSSLKELDNAKDGKYQYTNIKNQLYFNCFKSEKKLVEYIAENAVLFTKQVFCDEYISHHIEHKIRAFDYFGPRSKRIDMVICAERNTYLIETKNTKSGNALRASIGQLLDYGREYSDPKKKMVLVSNCFDASTAQTIEHYKLPITYIILSATQALEYCGNA